MEEIKLTDTSFSSNTSTHNDFRYNKKLVIVGDAYTGKTALLVACRSNQFSPVYVPTVFDCGSKLFNFEDKKVDMRFWDTSGKDDYIRLRPLSYPNSHVVLLCYSIDSRESLNNVIEKWSSEVFHYCKKNASILLVGCKVDLRNDPDTIAKLKLQNTVSISKEEGIRAAEEIGAIQHIETSALTGYGIKELFEEAVKVTMTDSNVVRKRKKLRICRCTIM
ncbi:hypothetical protein TPHA_0I03140 [Tetrapisispora phaffii CBS 4417]|uniref:GTP-binding protein RHO4 n=1 Tax=Tetrapisispora phaffii (strain ATCC 24235 / CBS 4417 / NBRC 1672 / NRRL Y-8282 / UCD 70-5) TaxID=1071381 RepID=G8BY37_TETPH|nr:hypothetical protein TPHA_0I03140 [Tetrapisispora phaffii CBS 4417]CCE64815.1 hypothetical protein TPHA_0I03140 [Tetrapisispora phaffii CBS 4417]